MTLIRIKKTEEVSRVLDKLRQERYPLLSDSELIKAVLSECYISNSQADLTVNDRKDLYKRIVKEGDRVGEELLKSKGLKKEDLTEDDLYNLIAED